MTDDATCDDAVAPSRGAPLAATRRGSHRATIARDGRQAVRANRDVAAAEAHRPLRAAMIQLMDLGLVEWIVVELEEQHASMRFAIAGASS